ncbi:MAG: rod shape-determining protein MreD [Planctomycetes bacterium]|nr:rod shape-determining protein MreD [Planctomycetota bacterium]
MQGLVIVLATAVLLAAQSVVAPCVELRGARPDWLLVVVVFGALHAPPASAVGYAWVLGLVGGLLSVERTGLLALSYALAAGLVAAVREYLFRNSALAQIVLTLAVALVVRGGWLLYRRVVDDPTTALVAGVATDVVPASLYTALWAPFIHRFLAGVARPLGFRSLTPPRARRFGSLRPRRGLS